MQEQENNKPQEDLPEAVKTKKTFFTKRTILIIILAFVVCAAGAYYLINQHFKADTLLGTSSIPPSILPAQTVDAKTNIFLAGMTTQPSPARPSDATSVLPKPILLPSSGGTVVFNSITGTTKCSASSAAMPPDGGNCAGIASTKINSYGGISGINVSTASMFLVGVFTKDGVPAAPAPGSTTYSSASLDNTSFSPALNQLFFIGDGLSKGKTNQGFIIPANATSLYLGFADAAGFSGDNGYFSDNTGTLTVNLQVNLKQVSCTNDTAYIAQLKSALSLVTGSSTPAGIDLSNANFKTAWQNSKNNIPTTPVTLTTDEVTKLQNHTFGQTDANNVGSRFLLTAYKPLETYAGIQVALLFDNTKTQFGQYNWVKIMNYYTDAVQMNAIYNQVNNCPHL